MTSPGKFSLQNLQCLRFGVSGAIFAGFNPRVAANHDKRLVQLIGRPVPQSLLANPVGFGRNGLKWRNKGAIRGTYADLIAHRGDPRTYPSHGIFCDSTR